jgi:hypothetical protein
MKSTSKTESLNTDELVDEAHALLRLVTLELTRLRAIEHAARRYLAAGFGPGLTSARIALKAVLAAKGP